MVIHYISHFFSRCNFINLFYFDFLKRNVFLYLLYFDNAPVLVKILVKILVKVTTKQYVD